MTKTFEFKVILQTGKDFFMVCKFYRSPNLGECHVGYQSFVAESEQQAIKLAQEVMA